MDQGTDTAVQGTEASMQEQAMPSKAELGFPARLIAGIRMKIRRLFKKEDPNIYPFF